MSMLKNVVLLSVKFGSGTSSKSGQPKPYKFANITYVKPAKAFINDQHNIQQAGFDTQEVNMPFDIGLFNEFKANCPFLVPVNLMLDADPENPARNVVSGFEVIKSPKKSDF